MSTGYRYPIPPIYTADSLYLGLLFVADFVGKRMVDVGEAFWKPDFLKTKNKLNSKKSQINRQINK